MMGNFSSKKTGYVSRKIENISILCRLRRLITRDQCTMQKIPHSVPRKLPNANKNNDKNKRLRFATTKNVVFCCNQRSSNDSIKKKKTEVFYVPSIFYFHTPF